MSEQTVAPQDDKEIDLLPIWQKIAANKVAVSVIILVFMAGFAAWNRFKTPVYQATASVIVPASSSPDFSLSSALGLSLPNNSPIGMIEAILKSEQALGAVSEEVGLKKKELRVKVSIAQRRGTDVVGIQVIDKDQDRALAATASYISILEKMFADLNVPLKAENLAILRKALTEQKEELAKVDQALKEFNETALTDAVSAELLQGQLSQLRVELGSTESSLAAARREVENRAAVAMEIPVDLPPATLWRTRLVDLEYQLAVALTRFGEKHPSIISIRASIAETKTAMKSEIAAYVESVQEGHIDPTGKADSPANGTTEYVGLETRRISLQSQVDAISKIVASIPEETKKRSELTREIETLSEVVKQLTVQAEQAALNNDVDPNRWEILDQPHLADKPVNKSYSKSLAMGLIFGLIFGAFYAVTRKS